MIISIIVFTVTSLLALVFGCKTLKEIYNRIEKLEAANNKEEIETETDQSYESVEQLKDCPFCGSDDVFYVEIYDGDILIDDAFEIGCGKCQITFSCGDSTKEDIARLWNRRDEK